MTSISLTELSQLARDLAGLLRLGYPTVEAVQKVSRSQHPGLGPVLERAVSGLQNGDSLTSTLEKEPTILPLFVRMVGSAEMSEALPEGLERAAFVMDDLAARRSRCFLAALYPSIVFTTVVLLMWMICVAGGGLLATMFNTFGVDLPLATRILIGLSAAGRSPLGVVLFFAPLVLLWMIVLGRTGWSWSVYRVPLFGAWLLRQEAVIYIKTVGHLLQLGSPLVDACRLAVEACSPPLRGRLLPVAARLEAGDALSAALAPCQVVPELGLWAIERREATESLRLLDIGDMMDRELDISMDRGLVLFEPLIFLGLLFAILFFIFAVFMPLYQLIGNL